MAAAPDPVKVLRSTSEKTNFQRLARLLIGGGTFIMRDLFDAIHPPKLLPTRLSSRVTINQLKAAKLTKPQWNCLYPSPGVYGKSTAFDITLLFRLLRTICNLSPPTTGWDALPASTDHSLTADLARVKSYRNSVYGHVKQSMEVTNDEFLSLWQEISETLVRIAGQISRTKKIEWQQAIDKLLVDPLTVEAETNVEELRDWYRRDMKVKKSLEGLISTTEDVRGRMGRLEATVQKEVKNTAEEVIDVMETIIREEAKDIKDQLREVNQSIKRLSCLTAECQPTGAQVKLVLDCKATVGSGRRGEASGMFVGTQEFQAGIQRAALPPRTFSDVQPVVTTGFSRENVENGGVTSTQDVLNSIASKLFQAVDPTKPEELNGFVTYLREVRKVLLIDAQTGSLIITVECSSLQILNELWEDYRSGHLSEMAQTFLVTEDILTKFGLNKVELTTTIMEEEYNACREYFLKHPGYCITLKCQSNDVKEYLLRCIKSKQESYDVKVRDGEDNLSFYISGQVQGLKKALDMIEKLSKDVEVTNKVFRQPGLKTFLETGDLDGRIKKIEEEENCFIRVEKNLGSAGATVHSHSAGATAVSASSGLVTSSGSDTLVTAHGHKISWKTGDITNEQADILVIPQGACFNAIKSSFNQDTIQAATQLKVGDIFVSSASMNLQCNHVIHCCFSSWYPDGEKTLRTIVQNCLLKGDELRETSIAFPVIGTRILAFPLHEASRIMLDEAIKSCENLQYTTLKDIRFVLYHKDEILLDAFQQEVMKIRNQGTKTVQSTGGMGEIVEITSDAFGKDILVIQASQQEQKSEWDPGESPDSSRLTKAAGQSSNLSVTVWVTGGSRASVKKAIDELQKIFSGACDTKKVNNEGIGSLSDMQINQLKQEAYRCDVEITVDKTVKCITVCGYSRDISNMLLKIIDEICKGIEKEKQKQEEDNAFMVSKLVEWSYTAREKKQLFDKKTNAQLELAHSKSESTAKVSINGREFVIDLKNKSGYSQRNGEQITVTRTPTEEVSLPDKWEPMPSNEPVITVTLSPSSAEYQDVLQIFLASSVNFPAPVNVKKIERVQNPDLYRAYILKKQAMDKTNGFNSERQLFHGTNGNNIHFINMQGFNRSFSGRGYGAQYGIGVYFSRDASCSLLYTNGGNEDRCIYLVRVLVGQYCQGAREMRTPPPKSPVRPEILYDSVVDKIVNPTTFVVFFDNQCYPEYIITLQYF